MYEMSNSNKMEWNASINMWISIAQDSLVFISDSNSFEWIIMQESLCKKLIQNWNMKNWQMPKLVNQMISILYKYHK